MTIIQAKPATLFGIYNCARDRQGEKTTNLVGVAEAAIYINSLGNVQLQMLDRFVTGGYDGALEAAAERAGVVNRHLAYLQDRMEAIYDIAKKKGSERDSRNF